MPEGYDIETLAEMLEEGELNPSDSVSAGAEQPPPGGTPVPSSTDAAEAGGASPEPDLPDPPENTTDDYSEYERKQQELEEDETGDEAAASVDNGSSESRIGDEYVQDELDIEDWKDRVREVIDKLRPFIQYDGGDIEIIEFDRPNVKVKMLGACVGCPSSVATLKHSMEQALRDEVPGFEEVIQVNDLADMA